MVEAIESGGGRIVERQDYCVSERQHFASAGACGSVAGRQHMGPVGRSRMALAESDRAGNARWASRRRLKLRSACTGTYGHSKGQRGVLSKLGQWQAGLGVRARDAGDRRLSHGTRKSQVRDICC